jgi:hypothetical protein
LEMGSCEPFSQAGLEHNPPDLSLPSS